MSWKRVSEGELTQRGITIQIFPEPSDIQSYRERHEPQVKGMHAHLSGLAMYSRKYSRKLREIYCTIEELEKDLKNAGYETHPVRNEWEKIEGKSASQQPSS